MTKSNKLLFIALGTGVVAALFVVHRSNERRMQQLEHQLRATMDQQASLGDETAASERRQVAALAASLTAASRTPAAPISQPIAAESPGADESSTQQEAAKKEITPEVRAARVDASFALQQVDPVWAHDTERTIGKALAQSVGTASLESLECKKTMCKARFRHDDQEHLTSFLDKLVGSSESVWKGEIYSYRDAAGADGVVRNSIYFWKEGVQSEETSTL
jgi:hypothetical protein